MHHAAGKTPAAVIRVLAGAGLASRAVPLALRTQVGPRGHVLGVDVTPAMLASGARHGRALGPGDLLAEQNLRPALQSSGWRLDEYEDAGGHFLARALPLARPGALRP